jgi:hypothetical protein
MAYDTPSACHYWVITVRPTSLPPSTKLSRNSSRRSQPKWLTPNIFLEGCRLQSPGGVATRLTDLDHITTTHITMLSCLLDWLDRAKDRETLTQVCAEAREKRLLARIDATAAVQNALLEHLSTQDDVLQELKVIPNAQSTLLEGRFSSVDAVLGQVKTILKDCLSSVDAVLGQVGTILDSYMAKLDGLRAQLPTPTFPETAVNAPPCSSLPPIPTSPPSSPVLVHHPPPPIPPSPHHPPTLTAPIPPNA